jgi:hypothetical protein
MAVIATVMIMVAVMGMVVMTEEFLDQSVWEVSRSQNVLVVAVEIDAMVKE